MTSKRGILAGIVGALLLPVALPSAADTVEAASVEIVEPLRPEEVLVSSALRFPDILEGLAERRAAEGDVLKAEGGFDVVFTADGFSRATGFWDGSVLNTEAERYFRPFSTRVYGGYRVSEGSFPIYEDINFTNTGGEFKIGAFFSLLRDRAIDPRRFGVADARLALQQADLELLMTQIGVQRQALLAYWRWTAAGHRLEVYRQLLEIAEARQAGVETQVRRGALAEIAITENLQNITRREILVAEAEREVAATANALSFYYRDALGRPIIPTAARLPPVDTMPALPGMDAVLDAPLPEIVRDRPELRAIRTAIERADLDITASENRLMPRLDLNLELSRDVGAVAEGGVSRDSTDTIVGFKFTVPFQRRAARGELSRARAERAAARQRERRLEDRIEIEIRTFLIDMQASLRLAELAERDVVQSQAMTTAERRRLESGASDFFLVNVREGTAADAEIRAINARLNAMVAKTNLDAATMNLTPLGLTD